MINSHSDEKSNNSNILFGTAVKNCLVLNFDKSKILVFARKAIQLFWTAEQITSFEYLRAKGTWNLHENHIVQLVLRSTLAEVEDN